MRPFLCFCACAAILGPGRSGAAGEAPAYALFSPAAISLLTSELGTPEGREVIRRAHEHLATPPNALPVVHTEGTLPHVGIRDQSVIAQRDWQIMLDLALAFRMTADARYRNAAERYFSTWLRIYRLSFNPIDETQMDQMILAFDVAGSDLTVESQEKMGQFLQTMADGYLAKIARAKREDIDNWQSHRIKLIVLAAFKAGDPGLILRAHQAFARQISVNIRPDGSVDDFTKRDALHYVVYDLEPLTVAALAAKAHGEDWFHGANPGAPSVALALDWLAPYALGQRTHQEFVHSTVPFDAARAKAGEVGYSGRWAPATSAYLYQLATIADPRYRTVFEHVVRANEGKPQAWVAIFARTGSLR